MVELGFGIYGLPFGDEHLVIGIDDLVIFEKNTLCGDDPFSVEFLDDHGSSCKRIYKAPAVLGTRFHLHRL